MELLLTDDYASHTPVYLANKVVSVCRPPAFGWWGFWRQPNTRPLVADHSAFMARKSFPEVACFCSYVVVSPDIVVCGRLLLPSSGLAAHSCILQYCPVIPVVWSMTVGGGWVIGLYRSMLLGSLVILLGILIHLFLSYCPIIVHYLVSCTFNCVVIPFIF